MATKAQIKAMMDKMECLHLTKFSQRFDETQAGTGAVLRLLDETSGTVTAGQISAVLGISTARVAALLKKMEAKGLITREHGVVDARVIIVRLTELGVKTVREMQNEMYRHMELMIDEIGEERLLEFFETANEIQRIMTPAKRDFRRKSDG